MFFTTFCKAAVQLSVDNSYSIELTAESYVKTAITALGKIIENFPHDQTHHVTAT